MRLIHTHQKLLVIVQTKSGGALVASCTLLAARKPLGLCQLRTVGRGANKEETWAQLRACPTRKRVWIAVFAGSPACSFFSPAMTQARRRRTRRTRRLLATASRR